MRHSLSLDGPEAHQGENWRVPADYRTNQQSSPEQQQQQQPNLPRLRRRVRISEPAGQGGPSSNSSTTTTTRRSSKPLVSPRARYVTSTVFDSPTAAAAAVASSFHRSDSLSSSEELQEATATIDRGGSGDTGSGSLDAWDRSGGPRERFGGLGAGRRGAAGFGSPRSLQRVRSGPAMYQVDEGSSAAQMIRMAGYPLELHEVVTPDGYLLRMERIPAKASHNVVFMMHGRCMGGGAAGIAGGTGCRCCGIWDGVWWSGEPALGSCCGAVLKGVHLVGAGVSGLAYYESCKLM